MRRRVCLPLLAACVAALPLGAAAQQPRIPVVGFLGISNPQTAAPWLAQWHEGLRDGGFVEGRNLTVEYRWAESDRTRVPGLVSDLVGRRIDIFVTPDPGAAVTAKQAATSVPIVFVHVADPVGLGLVASLNRPGGNVTGIANFEGLAAKQLQLLRGLVPAAKRIGYLVDHKSSFWRGERTDQDILSAADVAARGCAFKSLRCEVPPISAGLVQHDPSPCGCRGYGGKHYDRAQTPRGLGGKASAPGTRADDPALGAGTNR